MFINYDTFENLAYIKPNCYWSFSTTPTPNTGLFAWIFHMTFSWLKIDKLLKTTVLMLSWLVYYDYCLFTEISSSSGPPSFQNGIMIVWYIVIILHAVQFVWSAVEKRNQGVSITVVVATSVSAFLVSSVIIFIVGFICGHWFSQERVRGCIQTSKD